MGQSVTLSCISHGGNPLAQIFWYKKDGDRWREVDMSYNTYGRESRNSFTFLASPSHNQAKFRCEAKNEMNLSPMTSEIVLSVQCKRTFSIPFETFFLFKGNEFLATLSYPV